MTIRQKTIPHIFRNKYLKNSSGGGGVTYIGGTSAGITHTHKNKEVLDSITDTDVESWKNKLDKAIWDKAFIIDDSDNLRVKLNLIGEQEVSAYGSGSTGSSGAITIVDALTSTATDAALSANQGRILKKLIDNAGGGVSSWNDLTDKPPTFTPSPHNHTVTDITNLSNLLDNKAAVSHTHTISNITNLQTTLDTKADNNALTAHTSNITLHITAVERTNWDKAFNNNHTHTNKSVLDGITSAKVTNWDNVYNNWNKAFYFDKSNNLRVKLNLIGEQEVSAYGSGSTGGSGAITIVDALTSTATDAALSANQGRILKKLIDNAGGGVSSWNDLKDKPPTFTPSAHNHTVTDINNLQTILDGKAASSHTHTIANVTGLQDALNGKAASSHTHNYVSMVKVGSTSYNVSSNIISLPAYPTVPTSLKNPNALTISLNGSSQGAYDGSVAKSINITAASVGAAASSHSHSYLPLSGGILTGNVTFSTDSSLVWNRNTDSFSIGFKNTGDGDADSYGWMKMADNGNEYFKWLQVNGSTTNELMSLKSDGLRFKGTKVSLEGHTHSQYLTSYTNNYLTGVSGSGNDTITFTRNGLSNLTWNASHSHNYAGSSSAGGAATSANKVNSTLTFTGYQSKSFNGSAAVSVIIPNNTSQLTNGAGFITSGASISGNAGSATKLQTARTINGTSFNGTANITTANWGTARNIYIQDATANNTSTAVSVNGGGNVNLKLPSNIKVGTLTATGEVTAYSTSDRRLKKNIKSISNSLNLIEKLNPVQFNWNKKAKELNKVKDERNNYGLIAQELEEVLPELVHSIYDKYKSIDYEQLIPILIQSIKELNNKINILQNKINIKQTI